MKALLSLIFCIISTACVAEMFGFNGYNIDKNLKHITKYGPNIYGIYIDYGLKGETLRNFANYCIIQKDTSSTQKIECRKEKGDEFVTDYMRMFTLINIDNKTTCIVNIMYYDSQNNLLQTQPLTKINQCRWDIIPPTSSIDEARDFIIKNISSIN